MTVLQIQQALTDAGFNPGPIDGVLGALTRNAIRAFQTAKELQADGIVGPNTRAKLFPNTAPEPATINWIPSDMPWMIEASRHAGLSEIPGPQHNPTIMNWASQLPNAGYSSDEVPWCGLFTAHSIASQMTDEAIPQNYLGARKWQGFGKPTTACFGAVLVFWRGKKDGWKGHVGFYWAEDDTHFHVLGGNQSNQVNIRRFHKKSRFLQARWPLTSMAKKFTRRSTDDGVGLSMTEQ